MTLHIFTSAALNYLPKVSRLVQSVKLYHPEAQVTLALADERPAGFDKPADFDQVVAVEDLGIEDWRAWTFGHTLVELATAIKPFVLERLLKDEPFARPPTRIDAPSSFLYTVLYAWPTAASVLSARPTPGAAPTGVNAARPAACRIR